MNRRYETELLLFPLFLTFNEAQLDLYKSRHASDEVIEGLLYL